MQIASGGICNAENPSGLMPINIPPPYTSNIVSRNRPARLAASRKAYRNGHRL